MQFQKVKKEIINSKKRYFVQNHTFYAKKRFFLQKVRNAVQKSIKWEKLIKVGTMLPSRYHVERWRFAKFFKRRPTCVLY